MTAAAISHGPTAASTPVNGQMYQAMETICSTVFTLPPGLAAITLTRATHRRSTVTPISRTRITMVTHHGRAPYTESRTTAVPVSALSAIGSASLPNEVTW